MGYNLGVDIGIASVGFAGVKENVQENANGILFSGAHIFDAAENPKNGESLALPRRTKRGLRRVIRRRASRKKAIRRLLEKHLDVDAGKIIDAHEAAPPNLSVWDLRKEAMARKLTDEELARALFHIAKHRGFQSNRKGVPENDLEGKKALSGGKALEEAMLKSGATTIGAYLATLPKKRNGDGVYDNFVTRDLLRDEVKKIFEGQRRFGQAKASQELQESFAEAAFFQRPLQSSYHMVGMCSLEPEEKRAPRFSYSAELFVLWSKLNNLRIKSLGADERPLTQDEKNRIADKAHKQKSLTYKQLRKELDIDDEGRFNLVSYRKVKDEENSWEKIREACEKADFIKLTGYHTLKDILGQSEAEWQSWIGNKIDKLDEIARILSFYEDEKEIRKLLAPIALEEKEINGLLQITNLKKSVDLSLKVIRNILPFMQQGLTYDKACEQAGYHHSKKDNAGLTLLPRFADIPNPVVNRALAQCRKVINAIIRKYGMPETIIVELARDVGRNFKDRKDIERQQKKNETIRGEARQQVEGKILGGRTATGEDVLKYRLWEEQERFCVYSGEYIQPETLRDPVATQIDHIIPYSRCFDDGYMNKVLCLTDENQKKGNKTPFEYLGSTQRWEDLRAMSRKLPTRKAERLLAEQVDEEGWKERNLTDTRYIARMLKNHIEQNLDLGKGNRVQTRNGMLTSNLRGAWGFPDKNRTNDRHHAVDALVLACSTQSMVQQLSNWNKFEARKKNPAQRPLPPAPWPDFRNDVLTAVFGPKNPETGKREGGIFISRMPNRKITGAAHEDTIRSIRTTPDGGRQIIQRIELTGLKPAMLENLVDKERNKKLYDTLKARLDAHKGKPDKAFAEPIYMPSNNPEKQGPVIRSVRVVTSEKSGVEVQSGLASNGDMVRVDVFAKKDKKGKTGFYLVPIYVHHFAAQQLPNKAIMAGKDEADWEEMVDEDFIFSLYKNDLVKIKSKSEENFGYYRLTDRSTDRISIRAHDKDPNYGKDGVMRTGVKTLLAFEKYSVDYFGNIHRIDKEPRIGLACAAHTKSSETGG